MDKRRGRRTWWVLACLAASAVGCDGQEDADRLARLGRKVAARVCAHTSDLGGKAAGPLQAIRGNWNEFTLDARVTCRLRWDKDLEGASIAAHGASGGAVELRGTVSGAEQRQRAVSLARATVGVNDVIDRMSEPERGASAP